MSIYYEIFPNVSVRNKVYQSDVRNRKTPMQIVAEELLLGKLRDYSFFWWYAEPSMGKTLMAKLLPLAYPGDVIFFFVKKAELRTI